ncbi:MAG TPA: outer membrane lipid asymmetry maintenance protein MlaD [Magnetospirillaceae bacterium]
MIGAAVLAVAAVVLGMAYSGKVNQEAPGYDLKARFAKADGISIGSEVQLAGVTVGQVIDQRLDPNFRALLTLRIDPKIQLPKDSAALIQTDGLLGSKFIALQPGADEKNLKPNSEFQFTQSSMNLNDILELIVSQAESKHGGKPPPDMPE